MRRSQRDETRGKATARLPFFFFGDEIFSKFVALKERLLNFLFCQYCAKKSGASVCVGVCEEFVLYEEEEEEEEVCKRFGVDEVIVCKE